MIEKELRINRIQHGTVIDHIKSGSAFNVLTALDINGTDGNQVSVAINVTSKQFEKKDIIKIENRVLAVEETNRLALISPNSTINIIKDYNITEKRSLQFAISSRVERPGGGHHGGSRQIRPFPREVHSDHFIFFLNIGTL